MPKKANTLKKLERQQPYIPSSDDPLTELRILVNQHRAITKSAVAIDHMSSDKTDKKTKAILKCRLPEDVMVDLQDTANRQRERARQLEAAMERELKKVPIWNVFLSKVWACGPVFGAYIVTLVNIRGTINKETGELRELKPSQLRRFFGMSVIDGRLERRKAGEKNHYCSELRVRLFLMFASMWKNSAAHFDQTTGEVKRRAVTTKYLNIWRDCKQRQLASGRVVDGKIARLVNGEAQSGKGNVVSANGFAHSAGWHKAADVFLGDLYMVWRALEGLPVWPTYNEWVTGYKHGGIQLQTPRGLNMPRTMTVDEALAEVGDVGAVVLPVLSAAE